MKSQPDYNTLIATLKDFSLLTYTIIDDLYKQFASSSVSQRHNVQQARLSHPEIINLSVCGELLGIDSENVSYYFVKKL